MLLLVLSGCAMPHIPISSDERNRQIFQDMAVQFAKEMPTDAPISIHQAMARAIYFNLPHRVKVMNEVLARGMVRVATQQMLPSLSAEAGYTGQNHLSTTSGQLSTKTADLGISWNVLDLGISYINASQQTDRVAIAKELQRKAAQTLLQEVRATYWQTVAAERLQKSIKPLKTKINAALASSRKAEAERIEPPTEALNYQVRLLETLQKIQRLQKQLANAKTKLAELMGLDPGMPFSLQASEKHDSIDMARLPKIETMEGYALRHRPELVEANYKRRIKAYETKKSILRLFPGLEFSQSLNYDNTESNANSVWSEFGINLTWNLINLFTAQETLSLAQDREKMEDISRLALNMSVMVQVHIALRNLNETQEAYEIAAQLSTAKERLYEHTQAAQQADTANELELISQEGERVLYLSQMDLAFAKVQNAAGAFLVSLGWDILPDDLSKIDYVALNSHLEQRNALLEAGQIPGISQSTPRNKKQPQTEEEQDPELDSPEWIITQPAAKIIPMRSLPPMQPKVTKAATLPARQDSHQQRTTTAVPQTTAKPLAKPTTLPPLQFKRITAATTTLPPLQFRPIINKETLLPPLKHQPIAVTTSQLQDSQFLMINDQMLSYGAKLW